MRARVVDANGVAHSLSHRGKVADIDAVLASLAEQVMDVVDPFVLGAYCGMREMNACKSKPSCDYSTAISQFKRTIDKIDMSNFDEEGRKRGYWAYLGWSITYGLSKNYAEEVKKLEWAIRYNPTAPAYNRWGAALRNLGESPEKALEKYRKAVELDPKNAYAYEGWGVLLYDRKDYADAILKYRKAVELDPKNVDAYYNWGKALGALGEQENAIVKYHKAAELNPKYAPPYVGWGNALVSLRKYNEEAIEQFHIAVLLDPKYADAYNGFWGFCCAIKETTGEPSKNSAKPWSFIRNILMPTTILANF